MKPLSPAARARLQPVMDFVLEHLGKGLPAHEVIDELIERHGAVSRFASGTHQLRCAGVVGQATSGASAQILASWRKAAMTRLMVGMYG